MEKIERDWPLYMDTKKDLISALVTTCYSGCSIFSFDVLGETLNLLPNKRLRTLAHEAVDAHKRCRVYEHDLTNDLTSAEFMELQNNRNDKISKLEKSLMRLTKSQLWEFIGFLLEDIEC